MTPETESIRQRLLELEAARQAEHRQRTDAELLLRGLRILGNLQSPDRALEQLLDMLCEGLQMPAAALAIGDEGRPLEVAARTGDFPDATHIPRDRIVEQTLQGRGRVFFDTRHVAEWLQQRGDEQPLARLASLLLLPIHGASRPALLILGAPAARRASPDALPRLRRLGSLVLQALVQRDLAQEQYRRLLQERERVEALARSQRQQQAIAALARTTAVAHGSRDEAFAAIVAAGKEGLQVFRGTIWLRDGDGFMLAWVDDDRAPATGSEPLPRIEDRDHPCYLRSLEENRVIDAADVATDARTVELCRGGGIPDSIAAVLDSAFRRDGRIAGFLCFSNDTTRHWLPDEIRFAGELADQVAQALTNAERRAAEQALQYERELAQITLQALSEAVIRTDSRGRIRFMNETARELTRWPRERALGHPLHTVVQLLDEHTGEPVAWVDDTGSMAIADQIDERDIVLVRSDGEEIAVEISGVNRLERPTWDQGGAGLVLAFSDVSERRRMARKMAYQARHDALTGMVNRFEFEHRLKTLIRDARTEGTHHALLYLDLDQFKIVNDTCGHPAGDQLLCQLSTLLARSLRDSDTLARVGGDEFGALLVRCCAQAAETVADKLVETVNNYRFTWEGRVFTIGVSIGLVLIDENTEDYAAVMRAADAACYAAKEEGRNRVRRYLAGDADLAERHGQMAWVSRINDALEHDRLRLMFQRIRPICAQCAGERRELLLRMVDGDDGRLIPPGTFLPAAERYDLMGRIDRWVIDRVLATLAAAKDHGAPRYALNISGVSVGDPGFDRFVEQRLETHGIDPARLCLEITETAAITHLNQAIHFINRMRRLGMEIALDDFGSGMSSFAYLKVLHVDYLKIDGTFVRDIARDRVNHAMVEAICGVARVMGVRTVAEYVEDEAILPRLEALGIDYGQGNALHCPEPWPPGTTE